MGASKMGWGWWITNSSVMDVVCFFVASASFGGRLPRCTSLNYLQCGETLKGN